MENEGSRQKDRDEDKDGEKGERRESEGSW